MNANDADCTVNVLRAKTKLNAKIYSFEIPLNGYSRYAIVTLYSMYNTVVWLLSLFINETRNSNMFWHETE